MLNRLGRFDIETWTRYAMLKPNGSNYKKPNQIEVGRKDVISRMYNREGRERVERFVIAHEDLFIVIDDSKEHERVFSLDSNYVFRPRCKFSDWAKSDVVKEFEEKNKRALAIEKLSNESQVNLMDDCFKDTQNVRITVSKGNTTYELATHKDFFSIDRRCYYFNLDGGKIVPVEIDYNQTLYFNNTNTFASYLNIPKERMYVIVNDPNFHDDDKRDFSGLFLDGEEIETGLEKTATLEEIMQKMNGTISNNISAQKISDKDFVDFNDVEVEFYVDNR